MGEIIWISLVMLVVACIAFAPLAYFIYMYRTQDLIKRETIEPKGTAT
jgi:hypothetical protein